MRACVNGSYGVMPDVGGSLRYFPSVLVHRVCESRAVDGKRNGNRNAIQAFDCSRNDARSVDNRLRNLDYVITLCSPAPRLMCGPCGTPR